MSIRTRFAPSPTGSLHVGGVRTALYAWLYARKHGGQFILRIEDTDKEREVEGSIGHIMECLTWLGLRWDEGPNIDGPHAPYIQSARLSLYKAYAERLVEKGFAYPDPYTEAELEQLRAQAQAEKRPFLFREHRPARIEEWDGAKALRFRVPEVKRYQWADLVRGALSAGEEALDDFVLVKADGYPTYNFAHIVDDIEMGITHVMRGEEFISSTPKFLSVYEALGEKPPAFATLPVILGPDGKKKLSKRDGAKDLLAYRAEGYVPAAMVNFLALLGWHPEGDTEILSIEELIAAFDLSKVQKGGARFDEEKLLHMNQEWMRRLTDEEYRAEGALEVPPARLGVIALLKERARTFGEARSLLAGELSYFFSAPAPRREGLVAKEPEGRAGLAKSALTAFLEAVHALSEDVSAETVKTALMPIAEAEEAKGKGGRGGALWPLRYALTGQERSPDPFTVISILGRAESGERIRNALGILG